MLSGRGKKANITNACNLVTIKILKGAGYREQPEL